MNKKIILIFIFAFLIRLIALNQSVWLDEAVTANVVKNFSFLQIITKFSPTDFHPPLYYLFMKLWTNAFGYSEIALRFPSIIFSLLTGYFVYKIAKLLNGYIAGLWTTAFFLFNPLIIYYSQEARMYMIATFLLTVGLYYLFESLRVNELTGYGFKNIILMNLFFILSFYTFYGSIFFIVTVFIYLIFKKKYKAFFVSCFLFLVSFALVSPLLYQQFINSKIALTNVANWTSVLGKSNIKNLLLIPIKFSIGRISFYPKWLYWIVAGGWTGYILYQISKFKDQNDKLKLKNIYLLYYLLIFPLVLGFLVSFFTPMLQYFRFLYLIPIICLIFGLGQSSRPMYNRGGYAMVGGFLMFSLIYLFLPQFHREDWKNLVRNLPKDSPVYMITASSDPVLYYSNRLSVNELTSLRVNELEKEIIVIPYTTEIYGLDYKNLLSEKGYRLKKEVGFRELTYEQWIRK